MKKFFVLFQIPVAAIDEWQKTTAPEKRKKMSDDMMHAWQKWMQKHEKAFVEKGAPLGKTKRVSAQGVTDVRNDLNWYAIVEADSHKEAAELFADHPHLEIPTSSVEVMEIPPTMGM